MNLPGSSVDIFDKNPPAKPPRAYLTPAQLLNAQLVVCGYAEDAEDAKELLEALGLLE